MSINNKMIIPIRCFTCNRVLASKYKTYKQIISNNTDDENIISGNPDFDPTKKTVYQEAFEKIGISDRYCCKRHMLAHIDLVQKI